MFKLLLLALFALCGMLCQAADLDLTGDDMITDQLAEDALVEAVTEDTGRGLLGARDHFFKHFNSHKFSSHKPSGGHKVSGGHKKKGKGKTHRSFSHKSFSSSKKTTLSSASCKAVAKASTRSSAKKKLIKAVAKAIIIGCGSKGKISIKKTVKVLDKATLAVAKATTSAFATCKSKGNAFGCAAAHAQATAYAKGFAKIIADAYALAANKCNYCTGVKASSFTTAIDVIKVFIYAESKASAHVCVKGDAKATAYEKCYAKTIAVGFAEAIAKAFLKTAGGCYEDAKAKAAVETQVETGYLEKFYGQCKGFTRKTKY